MRGLPIHQCFPALVSLAVLDSVTGYYYNGHAYVVEIAYEHIARALSNSNIKICLIHLPFWGLSPKMQPYLHCLAVPAGYDQGRNFGILMCNVSTEPQIPIRILVRRNYCQATKIATLCMCTTQKALNIV